MSYSYYLLGLDTLELIGLGDEKNAAMKWGVWDHEGPIIDLRLLGYGAEPKDVMLPKPMLEKLYKRFAEANPKGTKIVMGEGYREYAPPGLTKREISDLEEEEKLFFLLDMDTSYSRLGDPNRIPRLCEYLPELLDQETLTQLAGDPEIDQSLMNQAYRDGALSRLYGPRHKRWSPEWAAYVEAHKKAQAGH